MKLHIEKRSVSPSTKNQDEQPLPTVSSIAVRLMEGFELKVRSVYEEVVDDPKGGRGREGGWKRRNYLCPSHHTWLE